MLHLHVFKKALNKIFFSFTSTVCMQNININNNINNYKHLYV